MWRRLLGKKAKRATPGRPDRPWELPPPPSLRPLALVEGAGVNVAGVTGYQPALAAAWKRANPLPSAGAVTATASLLPEPNNPYDPQSIRVLIGPDTVGYLPAKIVTRYLHLLEPLTASGWLPQCPAKIFWAEERSTYVLRLLIATPAKVVPKIPAEAGEGDRVPPASGEERDRTAEARDQESELNDHSATDREASSSDRDPAARDRATSSFDALTGSYRRDSGMIELQREATRAQRTGTPFVLAFVDIDGLNAVNDSLGHAAGDDLLRRVVDTLQASLRRYDLIIRVGGDEFVCGMPDVDMAVAEERFTSVNAGLAMTQHASVSVGLAQLEASESVEHLIRRADADLHRRRGRGRPTP
jgi:diguanylate cyclase (GGDEF)-like protein